MKKKVEQKKPETLEVAVINLKSQSDREHNDDNFYSNPSQGIFAVFDGVSQGGAGYEASEIARQSFEKNVSSNPPTHPISASYLTDLLTAANSEIVSGTKGHTTGIAGIIDENGKLMLANVGDSAAYLFRGEELYKLSIDQTITELIKQTTDETEALIANPKKPKKYSSIRTNYLGKKQELAGIGAKVHFNGELDYLQLEEGDLLMLATDGITCNIPEETVKNLATNYTNLDELLKNIVAENYRAVEGADDKYVEDITIIAVKYEGKNMQKKNVTGDNKKVDVNVKPEKGTQDSVKISGTYSGDAPSEDCSKKSKNEDEDKKPSPQINFSNPPTAGTASQATYASQPPPQNAWSPDEFDKLITSTRRYAKPGCNRNQPEENPKEKDLESAVTGATALHFYQGPRKHARHTAKTSTLESLDLSDRAYSLLKEQKYEQAYRIYEKIISEHTPEQLENGIIIANGAYAALYSGKLSKSIEWSQRALDIMKSKQQNENSEDEQTKNKVCQVLFTKAIAYEKLADKTPEISQNYLTEALGIMEFLIRENYDDVLLQKKISAVRKKLHGI